MSRPKLPKPTRTYSKQVTVANNVAAWIAIGVAIYLGPEMAAAVVSVMVILIASLLGIYQGVGHFDLRAIRDGEAAPSNFESAPP
jgi:hypothetical protein